MVEYPSEIADLESIAYLMGNPLTPKEINDLDIPNTKILTGKDERREYDSEVKSFYDDCGI